MRDSFHKWEAISDETQDVEYRMLQVSRVFYHGMLIGETPIELPVESQLGIQVAILLVL